MPLDRTIESNAGRTAAGEKHVPWLARITGHIPPGQFGRYLIVGAWNTLFGYCTYSLLTALLMPRLRFGYIYASAFSSLINITVAYLGYKFFVFRTRGNYVVEWLRCILVYGSGMLPGLVLLPLLVAGLDRGFHLQRSAPYIAGAILMGLAAGYSFLGHKHFSFRVPANAAREAAAGQPDTIQEITAGAVPEQLKTR